MQRLNDTTLTVKKKYSINFTKQHKKVCLSLHYNGVNNYIFVNGVEIYKCKVKQCEKMQLYCFWGMFQKIFQLII